MKITSITIGFITAFISYQVLGQSPSVLTFEQAIKIGLDKNVSLKVQENQLLYSQARRLQGFGSYLPNLYAQGFAQRTNGLQIAPTTGVGSNVTADNIYGSINANYVIFNGFNRSNTFKQSNKLLSGQSSLVERSKQDVLFNISSQYLLVLLDQELLRIAQENLIAQQTTLNQTKGFVEVGSRSMSDEYNQNALVKNLEVTYLRAKVTLENDKASLAQTLQLDPIDSFNVARPSWVNDLEFFQSLSLDSLYNIALKNRADLKQQNDMVEANRYAMKAGSSGYYPTLSLYASYGSTYYANSATKANPDRPSFKTQFTQSNPATTYGVNLYIPIFDRLQTRTTRSLAKVNYENTMLTRNNLERTIKIDVQRTFKNYGTAVESYSASLAQYEAADIALKTQQESYALGISSQVALAQANQLYIQALSSKAQAEVTLLFQKILMDYSLGTLKVDVVY